VTKANNVKLHQAI